MAGIRWVLATDIDGTLVGYGGEGVLAEYLSEHPEIGVVYLTGRTRANAEAMIRQHEFPKPLALATDIGADIFWGPDLVLDDGWAFQQRRHWSPRRVQLALDDLSCVEFLGRCSHWRMAYRVTEENAVAQVRARLVKAGVACRALWDAADERVDIIPRSALKGRALKHILDTLGMKPQQCFVAGDAENDGDMLESRYQGVLVANAVSSLRQHLPEHIRRSSYPGAFGVMDGLSRWLGDTSTPLPFNVPEFVS